MHGNIHDKYIYVTFTINMNDVGHISHIMVALLLRRRARFVCTCFAVYHHIFIIFEFLNRLLVFIVFSSFVIDANCF